MKLLGCILDDYEIIGGDLNRKGVFADRDDDCAIQCEDNSDCQ